MATHAPKLLTRAIAGAAISMIVSGSSAPHAIDHNDHHYTRYFAEGATGFFQTSFGLVNPSETDVANVSFTFLSESGVVGTHQLTLQPRQRQTVSANAVLSYVGSISTIVESDGPIAADRLMQWGAPVDGSHIDAGVDAPSTTWYLPEGATGPSQLYYMLLNPGLEAASVQVTFLREDATPILRTYTVEPRSRKTILVNAEAPELEGTSVGAAISANVPIVAEQAMYFSAQRLFGAGTAGAGVPSLATQWFFAEGATGSFFDEFIALINPSETQQATVRLTYHLDSGVTLTKSYGVAPRSRETVYLNNEAGTDPALAALASAAVWISVDSDVPIAAARAMWWPHLGPWNEGHASVGHAAPAPAWVVPEGSEGGPASDQTFIMIANPSTDAGQVRLTLLEDGGETRTRTLPIDAGQRLTISVATEFELTPPPSVPPSSPALRYSVFVESVGSPEVPLIVDHARYSSPDGRVWEAAGASGAIPMTLTATPPPADQAPMVLSTDPSNGSINVTPDRTIAITFSEPVQASAGAFTIDCPSATAPAFSVSGSGGGSVLTLTPAGAGLPAGAICTVTVVAAGITDVDTSDPPDQLAADYQFSFSVPPIAAIDGYAAIGHVTVDSSTGTPFTVLANDRFALPLTSVAVASPSTANGGTITMIGAGAGQGQFVYVPPVGFSGTDSFTYLIANAAGTASATVTFSVGTPIWFINMTPGACTAGCDGRQATPFTNSGAFQAINDGAGAHPAAGDHIFIYEGVPGSHEAITLLPGQRLIGQDALAPLLDITGHGALPPGSTVPATDGVAGIDVDSYAYAGPVRLADNVVVRGLAIVGTGANAIDDPAAPIAGVTVSDIRISMTSGGHAVLLSDFAGNVSLISVVASGGPHGISLTNTTGSFTVTGIDGNDADSEPDSHSGGTMSNSIGSSAQFVNHTGALSLNGLSIITSVTSGGAASTNCDAPAVEDTSVCNAAIHFVGVDGSIHMQSVYLDTGQQLGINAADVNNLTMNAVEVKHMGTDSNESGVVIRNLTGTSTVTNSSFTGNDGTQFLVGNASGTGILTIQNSTFGNELGRTAETGLLITAANPGTNLTVHAGGLGAGEALAFDDLIRHGWRVVASNGASITATLRGSTMTNTDGVMVEASQNGTVTSTIENNTLIAGPASNNSPFSMLTATGGGMQVQAIGNVIGQDGVADSGTRCSGCTGIAVDSRGSGSLTLDVVGNTIQNVDGSAIVVLAGEAASKNVNARITGNLIRQPGPSVTESGEAIAIYNGLTSGPTDAGCMALRLGGAVTPAAWPSTTTNAANRIMGVWDSLVFGTEVRLSQEQSTIIRLPGLAGDVATYLENNNVFDGGAGDASVSADIPANIQAGTTCP
jgi:hypothetical protein